MCQGWWSYTSTSIQGFASSCPAEGCPAFGDLVASITRPPPLVSQEPRLINHQKDAMLWLASVVAAGACWHRPPLPSPKKHGGILWLCPGAPWTPPPCRHTPMGNLSCAGSFSDWRPAFDDLQRAAMLITNLLQPIDYLQIRRGRSGGGRIDFRTPSTPLLTIEDFLHLMRLRVHNLVV